MGSVHNSQINLVKQWFSNILLARHTCMQKHTLGGNSMA